MKTYKISTYTNRAILTALNEFKNLLNADVEDKNIVSERPVLI